MKYDQSKPLDVFDDLDEPKAKPPQLEDPSQSSTRRFLGTALLLLLPVFLFAIIAGSVVRVDANQVAVRSNNFGILGPKGLLRVDLEPGWHLNIPLIHSITIYPARVRKVEFTKDLRQRSELGNDALLFHSVDGDRVIVDVHVFFRILPGSAHRLLEDSGPGDGHVHLLRNLAAEHLRNEFGKLHTEQFYDPAARQARTTAALDALKKTMEQHFVEVLELAIQDIEFESKYEQKIRDKKLADQNVELNKAEGRVAAERFKVDEIKVETSNLVAMIEVESQTEVDRITAESTKQANALRAESALYAETNRAQGQLAIASANAQTTQAKTHALAGSGGKNLAALEAVRNLKISQLSFPTAGRDWFDVQEMAQRLGARPD